jgi:hypothetical protein
MLCGCVDINSTKLSEDAKASAVASETMVKQKGAAVVARITWSQKYCTNGTAQLNRIVEGRISDEFYTVGEVRPPSDKDRNGLAELGKAYVHFLTLNFAALPKGVDIRTAFVPIEPGTYVVTRVECTYGRTRAVLGGERLPSLFEKPVKYTPKPVLGDNYITIGNGEIVDAGILDLDVIEDAHFFGDGKARIIASEAPPVFREAIKQNLPELYPRITYKRFAPYLGFVLSSLPNPIPSAKETHAKAQ